MGLRDRYAYAIQTSKGRFQGNAEERDGKLHFSGTVATEDDKNQIWNAIKTIPDWQKEVVGDIRVTGGAARAAAPAACACVNRHVGSCRGPDVHGAARRYAEQDRQGAPR